MAAAAAKQRAALRTRRVPLQRPTAGAAAVPCLRRRDSAGRRWSSRACRSPRSATRRFCKGPLQPQTMHRAAPCCARVQRGALGCNGGHSGAGSPAAAVPGRPAEDRRERPRWCGAERAGVVRAMPVPRCVPGCRHPDVSFPHRPAVMSRDCAEYSEWSLRGRYSLQASRAVNQAIGRVIRHRNDFGAVPPFCALPTRAAPAPALTAASRVTAAAAWQSDGVLA